MSFLSIKYSVKCYLWSFFPQVDINKIANLLDDKFGDEHKRLAFAYSLNEYTQLLVRSKMMGYANEIKKVSTLIDLFFVMGMQNFPLTRYQNHLSKKQLDKLTHLCEQLESYAARHPHLRDTYEFGRNFGENFFALNFSEFLALVFSEPNAETKLSRIIDAGEKLGISKSLLPKRR